MKYAFIETQRTHHSIKRLCRVLSVSTAAFYGWRSSVLTKAGKRNQHLSAEISRIHRESRGIYGRPRIHAELKASGHRVGAKRVGRLMKVEGIAGKSPRRFRKTTDSNHAFPIADNRLERKFAVKDVGGPNRVWAGDITYLATREGWLYLAIVIDLFSRKVIGWSIASTMHRDLVIKALRAAIKARRPNSPVLFHSDRGSQYASTEFREELANHGFTASMSGKGECWDNAVVESFFGSMKSELDDPIWDSKEDAKSAIFEYLEIWYNLRRRHSTLGYVSPDEFESQLPIAA